MSASVPDVADRLKLALLVASLLLARTATALPGVTGLPGQGFVLVEDGRTVQEDWGWVTVRLEGESKPVMLPPGGGAAPAVCARSGAGACELTTTIFRAPTDPSGSEVICAEVRNRSAQPGSARIVVAHNVSGPEAALSDEALTLGPRRLVALPGYEKPTLPTNDWGLDSNASPQPGWAHPDQPCDPAFSNIRVGWYGAPITYRFRVEPGSARLIMLGVCESHWAEGGKRPLILQVEGAADQRVDPVTDWGRHVPKCLPFAAKDANGDGWLTVASVCPPNVPDTNSILNAIWVFPAGAAEDPEAVKRGERSDRAQAYVQVGGQKDRSLHKVGDVIYDLPLKPGETRTLTFLIGSRGASAPPAPKTAIDADRYRADADRLWREFLDAGCRIHVPDPAVERVWNASLQAIMMARGQCSKYVVPLATGDPSRFSYADACDIIRALDLSGHHKEAEECLLMLWDRPLPEPIAKWGQREDGGWGTAPDGDWGVQARVMTALAQHGLLTGNTGWGAAVLPSLAKGADWLASGPATRPYSVWDREAVGCIEAAGSLATTLGNREAARQMSSQARAFRERTNAPPQAGAAARLARPNETVPFDHWAYDALQKLVDLGVLIGVPDGSFKGDRALTRQEFAEAIRPLAAGIDGTEPVDGTPSDSEALLICVKLAEEFAPELALAPPRPTQASVGVVPALLARELRAAALDASPQGFVDGRERRPGLTGPGGMPGPSAARAARFILLARWALVHESTGGLALIPGVPADWLSGAEGVSAEAMPTQSGPVNFKARFLSSADGASGALKAAITPPQREAVKIGVATPAMGKRKPVKVEVEPAACQATLAPDGTMAWLSPTKTRVVLTVFYQ